MTKANDKAEEQCSEDPEDFKKKFEEMKKKYGMGSPMEKMLEGGVDKGKDFAKGIFEAMMKREVQEHFIAMGVEFMLGMAEFMKALPIPEDIKSTVKGEIKKDTCSDCKGPEPKKKPATSKKKSIEKIELQ